jgi:hypothetical protein
MRRYLLMTTAVVIAITTLGVFLTPAPPRGGTRLFFRLHAAPARTSQQTYTVTLSNAAQCPLLYAGASTKPWYELSVLRNGTWQQSRIHTPGGGNGVIYPHQTLPTTIQVPEGATALKIGLEVTALTWRGRLGWWIVGSRLSGILRPVAGFMLGRDESAGSTVEWSEEFQTTEDLNGPRDKVVH